MSTDEINTAIAEIEGWKGVHRTQKEGYLYQCLVGKRSSGPVEPIPNYCKDTHAIMEAVRRLDTRGRNHFLDQLQEVLGIPNMRALDAMSATPKELAEAFLRTKTAGPYRIEL